jgi:hypothetical protein
MCWMKYHNHIHVKEIQSWIKQGIQPKHRIMDLWIQRQPYYFQQFVHFVRKDMQSWIVLLCLFTSKKILLNMWSYRMWQEH